MVSSPSPRKRARAGERFVGSLDFSEEMQDRPDGPGNVKDLFDWAPWAFDRLSRSDAAPVRLQQLSKNVSRGIAMHSFYTGKGTDGTIAMYLTRLFKDMQVIAPDCAGIVPVSCCEVDKTCLQLLQEMKDQTGQPLYRHVFGDVTCRYKTEHQELMPHFIPDGRASAHTKVEAYEHLKQYLQHALLEGALYPQAGRVAHCYQHGGLCPLHDMSVPQTSPLSDLPQSSHAQPGSMAAPPLKGVVAGSCCEDWSRFGSRQGLAGPKMLPWQCFRTEIEASQPDFVFLENSDSCPAEFYEQSFEKDWDMISGISNPLDFGWPCKRPRRYTFMWKKSQFLLAGSFEEYLNVFRVAPKLAGDAFFLASSADRQADRVALAAKRGNSFAADAQVPMESMLTAREILRYNTILQEAPRRESIEGVCISDIDQNPPFTSICKYVPPLIKHGKIVNLKTGEILLPQELLAVQGEATFEGICNPRFPCEMWRASTRLKCSPAVLTKMAGNAFHIIQMGTFYLYCLSALVPRASVSSFSRRSTQLALDVERSHSWGLIEDEEWPEGPET